MSAVINSGNLVLFGVEKWGDVDVSPLPNYTAEQSAPTFLAHVAPYVPRDAMRKAHLEYVPLARGEDPQSVLVGQGLDYRLAWVFEPRFEGTDADWEAIVDANSGDLLAFADRTNYVAVPRNVIGHTYPVTNDGTSPGGSLVNNPVPFVNLTVGPDTFTTDAGGNLQACVDGTATTTLTGAYIKISDNCGAVNESSSTATLDLGGLPPPATPHDCTIPAGHSAGDTASARSAYYEINHMAEMARGQLPNNPWIRQPLQVNVNITQTCNANGGAAQLNFYRTGGGCTNTGEIAGVFDHEWGHGMDSSDATPGISLPGESIADIYAGLRLNTSCVGYNFRPGVVCGGYGNACIPLGSGGCTGVRDSDWAKHVQNTPSTITTITTGGWACPLQGTRGPCNRETHCEGSVPSEAVWDLWNRDLTAAPFNQSLDTAREVATRLTFIGSGGVTSWYSCNATTGGCGATTGYMNYLAADDDNGNLNDGTPHMQAIFAAYNRHQIACATPTVQNSGCAGAPTSAPTVSTVALDRGAIINWTSVAGATSYRIFRTEGEFGCNFGKVWIGETDGLTWTDTDGLANGRTYRYIVMAMGNGDSCFGPASSCASVTPTAGANFTAVSGANVSFNSGDADDYLDNCESASISFDVNNIGTGTLNNLHIVSVSSPSHPLMDATVSNLGTVASLAACATSPIGFDVVGAGLVVAETIEFDVVLTSNELSPQTKTVHLEIPFAETDLVNTPSKTFTFENGTEGWQVVSGTFNRSGAGGGNATTFSERSSALLDNQCDRIRSPLMGITSTSTLSLWNNYDIEPFSGTWYDRANVALEDDGGIRTVVSPTSGRTYNASNGGPGAYSGCNDGEPGWAATQNTWGTSSWTTAAFGVPLNGKTGQLEITYSTDGGLAQNGFWFDEVTVTNVLLAGEDTSSNICAENPLIFRDNFETSDISRWDDTNP
ncbi:MAG: hypothetical protein R2862_10245 [Thermoanaerobaculia bacterium]